MLRELEHTRTALLPSWLGEDVVHFMGRIGALLAEMGGFPLPKLPALQPESKSEYLYQPIRIRVEEVKNGSVQPVDRGARGV